MSERSADRLPISTPVEALPSFGSSGKVQGRKHALAFFLSIPQGWTNMYCLWRYTTFSSMMTGNFLLFFQAIILDHDIYEACLQLAVFFSYALGFAVYRFLAIVLQAYTSGMAVGLFAALLLVVSDVLIHYGPGGESLPSLGPEDYSATDVQYIHPNPAGPGYGLIPAAIAAGCINAASLVANTGIVTWMVTVYLQNSTNRLVDLCLGVGKPSDKCEGLVQPLVCTAGMAAGAASSAVLIHVWYDSWSLSIAAVLYFLALTGHDVAYAAERELVVAKAAQDQDALAALTQRFTRRTVRMTTAAISNSLTTAAIPNSLRRSIRKEGLEDTPNLQGLEDTPLAEFKINGKGGGSESSSGHGWSVSIELTTFDSAIGAAAGCERAAEARP